MGEFNTVGLEDIIDAFSRREAATVEAVPKMLKAGADVLIEAQRAEAQAMGLNETGGFINSIKATDVKGDDTEKYVEIYHRDGQSMETTEKEIKARCAMQQSLCGRVRHKQPRCTPLYDSGKRKGARKGSRGTAQYMGE